MAMSKVRLDKLWTMYSTDLKTRKKKGKKGRTCKELHIATRWSVWDVIGHLKTIYQNNDRCRFLSVPDIDPDTGESNFEYEYGGLEDTLKFKPVPRKNTHPTVKPTSLMQYLIRLVTPKGGTILDPFNGSGSTGKAAMYENKDRNADYKYIGIELTPEYIPISIARMEYVAGKKEEKIKEIPTNTQMSIFDFLA